VGANPTAVAAYNARSVVVTGGGGCDTYKTTYSGATNAIVTNSGGNTVSILDLVNAVLATTITVGNHPVALAISADNKTAYVANYGDSTVSQVSLTTNTVTATVAVGGQPTSVTITSGGTLWAGGAGFLTQINTSNMSVVGTETAYVMNIVALSYTDQLSQLIIQSTDSTGAVYEDEMNPTAFAAGGTYSALASHNVSTLGTYTSGSTQIRAFTSTLSSSSSIPINLPGAPPLVVQDGWAVITATPTGFTITDASGHVVLVSETTPSPITAIAVDSKLNVAYLTMPDSNTMLTVPLPGTN
jgi:YVTN family beta-propeller protein